ncbi:MAG TPA: helix-turn-helix transcriptional regulator [Patescibacteria group bacterium]|nr:helix-turn-helix transcriptional regulator [Patescibacteria group bacterium]
MLAARRGELGLSIRQAATATRISPHQLEALEADDPQAFAAPVYAQGHLKTYARFLGLEPSLAAVPAADRPQADLALKLENPHHRPRAMLTGPAVAGLAVVLLAGALAGYAWRQVLADPRPGSAGLAPVVTPAAVSPVPARPIVVGVHVTDSVWVNVTVDGQAQYGAQGTTFTAGSTAYFTGTVVKITSGKASATFISIDGRNLGALGIGVETRDFTSQTSH